MACATQNFKILQGETFQKVLRWESPPIVYKVITAATQTAPVSLTVASHGMPDGWRCAITNVGGMEELNAKYSPPRNSDYHKGTVIDPSTIELNDVNAAGYTPYTSGGVLQYNTPVDLTGFTGEMDIRASASSTTVLHTLTTGNGGIVLDLVNYTITLFISAVDTAAFTWTQAVYDLEMTDGGGVVTRLLSGNITVSKEVSKV